MSGPEKSLLDRLSALKGGGNPGLSLDRSSNALNIALTGIEPAKPPSREDALAARLRSLRNTPEREDLSHATAPPQQQPPQNSNKVLGKQVPAVNHRGEPVTLSPASPSRSYSETSPHPLSARPPGAKPAPTSDDVDPFLQTDDQTLADLLGDEDLLDSEPQQWSFDPKTEAAKVNALLEELSQVSPGQHAPEHQQEVTSDAEGQKSPTGRKADDDSDGEDMKREVETLLSQALDEANFNPQTKEVSESPPASDKGQAAAATGDPGLSLPSVPSTIAALPSTGDGLPELSLPSVPSGAIKSKNDAATDFDSEIAARIAALNGLGDPSDGGGMSLPSVPTFRPADRAVKRLTSKTGYTDDDAETWCTVCLEDATLRCLGCEDIYCTRCWHEMHVGSAAAFDDRTHKAVQFVKPGKDQQRRVALGAS